MGRMTPGTRWQPRALAHEGAAHWRGALVLLACLLAVDGVAQRAWAAEGGGKAPTAAAKDAEGTSSTGQQTAPAGRDLVSDPDALTSAGKDAAASAQGKGATKGRSLSSARARSKPKPVAPADPVQVLPPVIAPQIRVPANIPGASSPGAAKPGTPSQPSQPTAPLVPAAPAVPAAPVVPSAPAAHARPQNN